MCNQQNQYLLVKSDYIILLFLTFSYFSDSLIQYVSLVSHVLFAVIYEDPDENFDPSLFKVPLHLNGSFKLPNMVFTDELLTLSSSEGQDLARQLEKKVWLFLCCCLQFYHHQKKSSFCTEVGDYKYVFTILKIEVQNLSKTHWHFCCCCYSDMIVIFWILLTLTILISCKIKYKSWWNNIHK